MKTDNFNSGSEEVLKGVPALSSGGYPDNLSRPSDLAGFNATAAAISIAAPPTPLTLLAALRRRYRLAIGIGPILGGLVAVGIWVLLPSSKYTARALLQVSASHPKVIFKTQENLVDFQTYQKTQQTLIKSREVLSTALKNAKVNKLPVILEQVDPVLWLEKKIQADFVGEVFRISMSGDKPEDLAALVNAVTEAYRKHVVEQEAQERFTRKDELQKIYDDYEKKLEQKRNDLKKLTQKTGSKDKQTLRYTQELAIERLSTVRRELIQVQSELRRTKAELEIRLTQQKAVSNQPVANEAEIQQLINEDEDVKRHLAQIAKLSSAKAETERLARNPNDPARQAAQKKLDTARKELNQWVTIVRSKALERLGSSGQDVEDPGVRDLRDRIGVLEELAKVNQTLFDSQSAENQEISQDTFYIDTIQDEILHADNASKEIGRELEVLKVELRAPSRVRQYETADVPRKEDDKRIYMASMAGLGTCGLFILGIAFLEFRTRRITSIDEVHQALGLRVMGSLPPLRQSARRGVKSDPYRGNLLTESIDSIRTMILHSTGERSLRTIMVTSASSGEGKTSLACHLATSLSRAGMKTLLIDCDLRKPTIHRLYDVSATPGFSEFLRGEVGADEVIRNTTADCPNLITAGACDSQALKALAQAATGTIFDEFCVSHDIVVVDTSPVLPVTDALLVGRHVDAAVYSLLRDVSRLPWTLAALGRLRSLNIRILGAVVTGLRSQSYEPYYNTYSSKAIDHV